MVVNPFATGGLYLLMNLPLGILAARLTRRPLLASAVVSVVVMGIGIPLRYQLPFHYWAHAQDFLYEPLIRDFIVLSPLKAIASLLFHLALPMLVVATIARTCGWTGERAPSR